MRRVYRLSAACIAATVLCTFTTTDGQVVFVDDDASTGGDGSSFSTPYKFLQDALEAARNDVSVLAIHMAIGSYRPDEADPGLGITANDRSATFEFVDGVDLVGGFPGVLGTS